MRGCLVQRNATLAAKTVAGLLRLNRTQIALALVQSVADWEKYAHDIETGEPEFADRETVAFVDYLAGFFATGDTLYRDLYVGEKLKQCYTEGDNAEQAIARRRQIMLRDEKAFLDTLASQAQPEALALLKEELDQLRDLLTRKSNKTCRALLVGDCFYLDLLGFATTALIDAGIQLVPTFITSKLVSEQHRGIRELKSESFDLVFYSPLTYAFNLEYSQLQFTRSALLNNSGLEAIVESAKSDIRATLSILGENLDCPIFVHNSSNIRRHDGSILDQTRNALTWRIRDRARGQINAWLPAFLEGLNSDAKRIFLIDETSLLRTTPERLLAKTLYSHGLQHPAFFGKAIAPVYENIIIAQSGLSKKKLFICDLDNTLWDGVIGEGAVEHYRDRQETLLKLRKKGMLLAICSKNDAGNVHWRGGVLSEDDFVCSQINWALKSENIVQISRRLNLKTKDFVFIDDRADERALVAEAMPDVSVLDGSAPRVWEQLAVLAEILPENTEGDRTLAYKQREERERFLGESGLDESGIGVQVNPVDTADAVATLYKLQLEVRIRFAGQKELARVGELINRTNQFNMNGARTTSKEVARWHSSPVHDIWVAEGRDKFGEMGTISVAVTERTSRGVEIIAFVLSCRVFGFGMERALLGRIQRSAMGDAVIGLFKETPHNGPCHKTYPDNGFSREGPDWISRGAEPIEDPVWLKVVDSTLERKATRPQPSLAKAAANV